MLKQFILVSVYSVMILLIMLPSGHAQTGFLKIENVEPGLNVSLNDSAVGETGDHLFPVPPGEYNLGVEHPDRGIWRIDDYVEKIIISEHDTLIVSPIFARQLIVRSIPFNADVLIDDEQIGQTPLYHTSTRIDTGILTVMKKDHIPFSIPLKELEDNYLDVRLQAIMKSELNEGGRDVHFWQRKGTLAALLFTIGAGVSTVYFNGKAEESYDKYLSSGDPGKMDQFFKDAERYDKYSNISLGVFEAGFVISLYSLLKAGEK
ncbi:MAG: hypothetical protein V2J62_12845 [candidate division KSB1 bacterium]|jgi:hypothetical protein|nr:hypothetical protein [candidate division KSB1 bacterium]